MSDKIYNKNAREKALLEEAYSNVYTEEVYDRSGVGWSGEHNILDVNSTEDLEYAEEGDAFLFDKVDEFAQAEGEVIERESDVMKFLSQFGSWEVEPNPNGHIVIKISHETGLTDSGEPDPNRDGYNYI
jgi:hypothetical protein